MESQSNLVIISMSWMTAEEPRRFSRMPQEPDMDTLTYWVTRLEPLIRADTEEEIIVVFCNRTGTEDEATYAGTSAVIGVREGEVKVYGLLGRGAKELLVVDTSNAPFARLVCRPDSPTIKTTTGEALKSSIPVPLDTPPISEADLDKDKAKTPKLEIDVTEKILEPSDSTEDSKTTPTRSSLQRRNTEPPIPPPVPTLPSVSPKTSRKPNIAPIEVQSRPARIYDPDSARSPGSLSNFPTPSAPSPTPMSLRPKLVIPQSPPIQPHQYPQDMPYSASSEISHHSLHSIKSNESEASIQTVKSNPRPPEDSTPYPHSGAPLSGYPANSQHPRRIYGGRVDISHLDSFSPTTPFDDISPISTDWHWRNPDSALRTPISGGGWMTGTPIGRHPEPFQWPVIQAIRVINKPDKEGKQTSEEPHPNDGARHAGGLDENVGVESTTDRPQHSTEESVVERPPSPKSRNASRSGRHERSNSTAGQHEVTPAVSQHLENIARRARSRSRSKTTTPGIERQSMSRASNRTPMQDLGGTLSPASHGTSRFAPSPNLFDRNRPGAPVIPTPAALDYYRTVPEVKSQRSRSGTRAESSATADGRRSVVRIPSRGRRPEPRELARIPQVPMTDGVRTSSADSTRNDVLHRKDSSRPSRPHGERQSSKTSHSRGQRRPSNDPDMQNFERVEAILCPSCPVHGRRSESARNARHSSSSNEERPRQRKRSDSVGHVPLLLPATTYEPPPKKSPPSTSTTQAGPSSLKPATSKLVEESTPITPRAPRQANFPPDVQQIADAVASLPDRPGTAPSKFDPVTPKAMVFDIREINSEPASAEPHNVSFATAHHDKGKAAAVS